MDFDFRTFSELLGRFVSEGSKIKVFRSRDICDVIAPLCGFLGIAKFVAVITDVAKIEELPPAPFIYFDNGNADDSRKITLTEELARGGYVSYSIFPVKDAPDWSEVELEHIILMEKQIFLFTERGHMIKLVSDLTLEDKEFGIKNLTYLMSTANQLIDQGHIDEYGIAFFNLHRFSLVNEKIGRNSANKVLIQFAQGLHDKLDKFGCVCRVGGDNFAVIFRSQQLDMVKKYLTGRYILTGNEQDTIKISASAGFYMMTKGAESASEIMDRASSACQLARNVYHRQFVFYDEDLMREQEHAREIESLFPKAIAKEEFQVFYQPKTQLNDYHIAGAEALCRWFRNGEMIPPYRFIP
ncbi:MAG: diguanylate cyclase domain-containing protein, partial [Oscillospiraceae bacterium]